MQLAPNVSLPDESLLVKQNASRKGVSQSS